MVPDHDEHPRTIEMPAPTAWPLVLALGLTLVAAGLVTSGAVGALGGALAFAGAVGWFRDVFPHERHEAVAVREHAVVVATSREEVARVEVSPELRRLRLPLRVYPIAAGVRGGLAGAVAMAVVAMAYGVVSGHGLWYAVNLLGGVVYGASVHPTAASLSRFHPVLFLVALALHLTTSVLVGLLYGTMLPMLPRHPIVLGGLVAPVLWSGLVHAVLRVVNPLMDARIEWWWFAASQLAFGVVAGLVVVRHTPVGVRQIMPLAMRAGIEATGMEADEDEEKEQREDS